MRKFLFVSSGILFLLISAFLIIIGAFESDEFLIITASMAVPFLFISYWNIFSVFYEKKITYPDEHFTSKTLNSRSIGVFYHRNISPPVFFILFISTGLAIASAFLAIDKSMQEIAALMPVLSFFICLFLTVRYSRKLNSAAGKS